MRDSIAPQYVGLGLRLTFMCFEQALGESRGSGPIPPGLEKDIHHLTSVVDCSPVVVLYAADFYEHFIDEEGVAVAMVFSF